MRFKIRLGWKFGKLWRHWRHQLRMRTVITPRVRPIALGYARRFRFALKSNENDRPTSLQKHLLWESDGTLTISCHRCYHKRAIKFTAIQARLSRQTYRPGLRAAPLRRSAKFIWRHNRASRREPGNCCGPPIHVMTGEMLRHRYFSNILLKA